MATCAQWNSFDFQHHKDKDVPSSLVPYSLKRTKEEKSHKAALVNDSIPTQKKWNNATHDKIANPWFTANVPVIGLIKDNLISTLIHRTPVSTTNVEFCPTWTYVRVRKIPALFKALRANWKAESEFRLSAAGISGRHSGLNPLLLCTWSKSAVQDNICWWVRQFRGANVLKLLFTFLVMHHIQFTAMCLDSDSFLS